VAKHAQGKSFATFGCDECLEEWGHFFILVDGSNFIRATLCRAIIVSVTVPHHKATFNLLRFAVDVSRFGTDAFERSRVTQSICAPAIQPFNQKRPVLIFPVLNSS
jgi:hypothetical protein